VAAVDEYVEANRAAAERVRALLDALSEDDLGTLMGEHWTVAIALAHLAYWDRRHAEVLQHNLDGLWAPEGEPDWMDDVQNDALLHEWRLLPPLQVPPLLLASMERIDWLVAAVPDDVLAELLRRDEAHLVRRSRHRHEHLDEIEGVLSR